MASEQPISFRPETAQRKLIDELSLQGLSATEVIKGGLEMLRAANAPARLPLYPRSVSDADVDVAIEEAAAAACARLDELFAGTGSPEVRGISSNFQGLLAEHLRAMLAGCSHANAGGTPLKSLLARADAFGRHLAPAQGQGVTLMRPAQRVGAPDLFFSEGRFVELQSVDVGGLFTSSAAAVKGYLAHLVQHDESPQEHPAHLVLIDYANEVLQVLNATNKTTVSGRQAQGLTAAQQAHIDSVDFADVREELAHYLRAGAQVTIGLQNEVPEAPPYAITVKGTEFWIGCYASAAKAAEAAKNLGLEVVS